MINRKDLSNEQWERLKSLLPSSKPRSRTRYQQAQTISPATRYKKLAANYTAMPSDRLHFVVVIVLVRL